MEFVVRFTAETGDSPGRAGRLTADLIEEMQAFVTNRLWLLPVGNVEVTVTEQP